MRGKNVNFEVVRSNIKDFFQASNAVLLFRRFGCTGAMD